MKKFIYTLMFWPLLNAFVCNKTDTISLYINGQLNYIVKSSCGTINISAVLVKESSGSDNLGKIYLRLHSDSLKQFDLRTKKYMEYIDNSGKVKMSSDKIKISSKETLFSFSINSQIENSDFLIRIIPNNFIFCKSNPIEIDTIAIGFMPGSP